MSFIFLGISFVTIFLYATKLYVLKKPEIGAVKALLFANLTCLVLYNFIYSVGSSDNFLASFIDNFVNSMMMSLVLLLNLVLIDSLKVADHLRGVEPGVRHLPAFLTKLMGNKLPLEAQNFLMPKLTICFFIFIALHFIMNTHSARLFAYITKMNQMSAASSTLQISSSITFD